VLDKQHRIYPQSLSAKVLPMLRSRAVAGAGNPSQTPVASNRAPDALRHEIDSLLIERYVPPGIHVDQDLQILSFHGEVGPFPVR
jgi:hypothetical protein